jgi:hypothetical protein
MFSVITLTPLYDDDDDIDDDDEYKPVWPSGPWATSQGGKTSKTSITRAFCVEVKWYLLINSSRW